MIDLYKEVSEVMKVITTNAIYSKRLNRAHNLLKDIRLEIRYLRIID